MKQRRKSWDWLWKGPLIGKLIPKIDNRHWTVDESTMWYGSKAKKIKTNEPIKDTAKQCQTGWGLTSSTENSAF